MSAPAPKQALPSRARHHDGFVAGQTRAPAAASRQACTAFRRRVAALLIGLLACLSAGCGPSGEAAGEASAPKGGPRSVMLITVDTLRADALGCYGRDSASTPHIDALAAGGARFAAAFSPRSVTLPALTTIMTGVPPLTHGVLGQAISLPASVTTLAEEVKAQGYRTGAFITNQCKTIVARDDHLGRGFDTRYCGELGDSVPQGEWDVNATKGAVDWLKSVPADEPLLLWVHFMDPHGDHSPPADLLPAGVPMQFIAQQNTILYNYEVNDIDPPKAELAYLWELYDAEIAGVDRNVEALVSAFRERSGNEGVIVFVADHGEELFDHNNFIGHGDSIHDSVLHVPLIFDAPGLIEPGVVVNTIVQLQDVSPTLLSLAGLPAQAGVEGHSLAPLMAPGRAPLLPSEAQRVAYGTRDRSVLTIRTDRYRYVINLQFPHHEDSLIPEFAYRGRFDHFRNAEMLFDVVNDPKEQHNLLETPPAPDSELAQVRKGLRAEVTRWSAMHPRSAEGAEPINDPAIFEELRQLGYLEFIPEENRNH